MSRSAQRRANDQRMQKHAEKVAKMQALDPTDTEKIKSRAKKMRDHLTVCSCQMCRNPRRAKVRGWKKETLQERRNKLPEE